MLLLAVTCLHLQQMRDTLCICVVHDENCSVSCMTVATEVAILAKSVLHIFAMHAGEEEGVPKVDSTRA
jgi:hypothetical protein